MVNLAPEIWSSQEIGDQLREVNRIFAQCDVQVRLRSSRKLKVQIPAYDYSDIREFSSSVLPQLHSSDKRLTLVFVPQFAGELRNDSPSGISFDEVWVQEAAGDPKYSQGIVYAVNTAWLTHTILTPQYRQLFTPEYNPTAHELAHLTLQAGHIADPKIQNILSAGEGRNDRFTKAQCATIRASHFVYPRP